MAKQVEFEEKEYEQPLNRELLFERGSLLWSPGQVFEEHFGIDAAIYTGDPRIWILFGFPNIPEGVVLNHFNWGYIWRKIGNKRQLPTFRTNLLLQTKRPERRSRGRSLFAKYGITGSYWQFQIRTHQQRALEKLCKVLGNRVLVCYASPAFHLLKDLFTYIENETLVDNSNFVQVYRLSNHGKWVYNCSGTTGIACSEIENISDKAFRDLIVAASESNNRTESVLDNLMFLEKSSLQVIEELGEENPIKNIFIRIRQRLVEIYGIDSREKETMAARAYFTFITFCKLTNTTWLPIGYKADSR
jgi:hypothetical protein